jgi:hypothetical protein
MLMRAVQRMRASRALRTLARVGLLSRAVLYLLLAYLAAAIAGGWHGEGGRPANANGALTTVAETPVGLVALVGAAVGFAAFGLVRLAGAYGDSSVGAPRRVTTAGQAAFYLAMSATTVAFLVGRRGTGSTEQGDSTVVSLVASPAGRVLLAAVGVAVVCVCLWQVRLAVQGGFADSLPTAEMRDGLVGATRVVGGIGIVARAAAVLPVGALLVVAAVAARPGAAKDLDELLMALARHPVGHPLVWAVAVGFLVFAVYSLLEVPYRQVHAGD